MQELRLRPYHDLEGAIFRPEAGWLIPAGYGSIEEEARAGRRRGGVVGLGGRAEGRPPGSRGGTVLDGPGTPHPEIPPPRVVAYGLFPDEKSRVVGGLGGYAVA